MSLNMSGSGEVGLGVGVGSYQPGVYVPLKALCLFSAYTKQCFKCTVRINQSDFTEECGEKSITRKP